MSTTTTKQKLNVLMVGTGEYTTGYVGGKGADSDKSAGVVAITMFDLRRRNKVARVGIVGVNGTKFPGIRNHMQTCISDVYDDMDLRCDTYPRDDSVDPKAYLAALDTFQRGGVAVILTPNDTHYKIALACIEQGLHVMVTKPICQTLTEHISLSTAAKQAG